MKDYGLGIGGFDGGDHAEGAALRRAVGGVTHEVDGGLDVIRGDGTAIVEEDTFAEMEDVGERSGGVPGFGEIGMEIHFVVALDQAVEDQRGETLGLGVGAETGIEIGGIGF
jgi:hypothetical protein